MVRGRFSVGKGFNNFNNGRIRESLPHNPGGMTEASWRDNYSVSGTGRIADAARDLMKRQVQAGYAAGSNHRNGSTLAKGYDGRLLETASPVVSPGQAIAMARQNEELFITSIQKRFRLGDDFTISLADGSCIINLDDLSYPPDYESYFDDYP